jgi:hypothetical protein
MFCLQSPKEAKLDLKLRLSLTKREKVNDYSGTIVSERRRWRTHTLGQIKKNWLGVTVKTKKLNVFHNIASLDSKH